MLLFITSNLSRKYLIRNHFNYYSLAQSHAIWTIDEHNIDVIGIFIKMYILIPTSYSYTLYSLNI